MNIFRRTMAGIQGLFGAILGSHDDSGRSEVTGAVNSTCKNVVSMKENHGTINLGSESNPGSPSSSQLTPNHELNHALIICHDEDLPKVRDLQDRLNKLSLTNGQRVRVVLEDDIECAEQIETVNFTSYFSKNALFFLFITEPFIKYNINKWKSDIGLTVSLKYGSDMDRERFVVPIFTEDKTKAPYLINDRILQSLTGIKYHECIWTEPTRKSFVRNFEKADKRIALIGEGSSVD